MFADCAGSCSALAFAVLYTIMTITSTINLFWTGSLALHQRSGRGVTGGAADTNQALISDVSAVSGMQQSQI